MKKVYISNNFLRSQFWRTELFSTLLYRVALNLTRHLFDKSAQINVPATFSYQSCSNDALVSSVTTATASVSGYSYVRSSITRVAFNDDQSFGKRRSTRRPASDAGRAWPRAKTRLRCCSCRPR